MAVQFMGDFNEVTELIFVIESVAIPENEIGSVLIYIGIIINGNIKAIIIPDNKKNLID